MKKLFFFLAVLSFLTSCASHSGRVCGGPGGGRCVDNTHITKTKFSKPLV